MLHLLCVPSFFCMYVCLLLLCVSRWSVGFINSLLVIRTIGNVLRFKKNVYSSNQSACLNAAVKQVHYKHITINTYSHYIHATHTLTHMADWPSVCHQHKTRIRITNTQCAPPEKHQTHYRHTGGDDDGQFWFNAHALVLRLSLACVMLAFYCALGRRDRRRARSKPALILNIQ